MIIDVCADIACPWCYVGRARLAEVPEQRPALDVTLQWRPFQLQPDLPSMGRNFRTVLEERFGGWDRAQNMFDRIQRMGKEEGLTFDFEGIKIAPNTADAHRLVLWADEQGVGDAVATALFEVYFSEGRNVSDQAVLVDCANEAGLSVESAQALLEKAEYAREVQESQQEAQQRGITGVPCYVFDGDRAVRGTQRAGVLTEALDVAVVEAPADG